jgi:hypothetical protein
MHYREIATVESELARWTGEPSCNASLKQWWVKKPRKIQCKFVFSIDDCIVLATGIYSHASALIIGVSQFCSTGNPALSAYPDLPGVVQSVKLLEKMWSGRGFDVETVVDEQKGEAVTRAKIVSAAFDLAERATERAGKDSLLIVHLIGHGVEDGKGGLLLSDANASPLGPVSRLGLLTLGGILQEEASWTGCNILLVCDFCNSGALIRPDEELTMNEITTPVQGYSRQMITSSISGASAFMTFDGRTTQMTKLLLCALDKTNPAAFRDGDEVLSAVELRRRLLTLDRSNTFQSALVGRIWNEWSGGTANNGDIVLYKYGNGVIS